MRTFAAALAAFFMLATQATAQAGWPKRMHIASGHNDCLYVVVIENKAGRYNAVEVMDVPDHGKIHVEYETIGMHNADDHDKISVRDLPWGLSAHPMEMDLPDGSVGHICLKEYIGA
jgi:hypothetical protein